MFNVTHWSIGPLGALVTWRDDPMPRAKRSRTNLSILNSLNQLCVFLDIDLKGLVPKAEAEFKNMLPSRFV